MLTLAILTALVLCVGNVSNAVYDLTLFLIFALHYSKGYFLAAWDGKAQTVLLNPDPRQQLRVTCI